jgi:hypothetical protein
MKMVLLAALALMALALLPGSAGAAGAATCSDYTRKLTCNAPLTRVMLTATGSTARLCHARA